MKSTLWSISFCPAIVKEDDLGEDEKIVEESDEENSCRHITIHPDQLLTTAIIDGLSPCTQYIIR